MPLPTLPLPPGVTWDARKTPRFSTVTQHPVSGARPVSFSVSPYPSWEWELSFSVLRDQGLSEVNSASDLKPDFFALQDFYLSMNGSNGRFIYDPAANAVPMEDTLVTQVTSGTLVNGYSGNTATGQTAYQLYRTSKITGSILPVEAIDALSALSSPFLANAFALYLNGTLVDPSLYTLSQYPLMANFLTAPTAGQALSWSGMYAYVAKFAEDKIDFNEFMANLWELQSLRIEQVPLGF